MNKIKIRIVYYYCEEYHDGDYFSNKIVYVDDPHVDWEEVTEQEFEYIFNNLHYLGAKACILKYCPTKNSVKQTISDIKTNIQNAIKKEQEEKEQKKLALSLREKKKTEKLLAKKKKTLEKLKKELGEV